MKNNQILIIALISAVSFFFLGQLSSRYKVVKTDSQVQEDVAENTQLPSDQKPPVAPTVDYDKLKLADKNDFTRGNKNAKITLIEYSDTECPFCKRHHETMLKIMENYGEEIAWVYRHYPLPFHEYAQKEAEATECVGDLGGTEKFWEYLDKVYEETTSNDGLDPERLAPMAAEIGLDSTEIQDCIDSGKFAENVADDLASGREADIHATPSTILVTKDQKTELIEGAIPYEQIEAILQKYL